MIPIRNKKKTLQGTVEEMRNFALSYVEKYAPSKQQLKTYLLKKLTVLVFYKFFLIQIKTSFLVVNYISRFNHFQRNIVFISVVNNLTVPR